MSSIIKFHSREKLIKTLSPAEKGRDDANTDKYKKDHAKPTEWEQDTKSYFLSEFSTLVHKTAQEKINDSHKSIGDINRSSLISSIKNIPTDLLAALSKEETVSKDVLQHYAHEKINGDKNYRSFILTHSLEGRKPEYPSSKLWFWAVLLGIVVIESIMNSYFLSKGSDLGLLGGFLSAFVISVINVLWAVFAGFTFRYSNHKILYKRIGGWLSPVIFMTIAVLFAAFVGHYRDKLETDPFNAAVDAVVSFYDAPFALENVNSWFLFAISIIAFLIAAVDAYKSDDPYPGYGGVDRERVNRDNSMHEAKAEFYEKMGLATNSSRDDLGTVNKKIIQDVELFKGVIIESENLVDAYEKEKSVVQERFNGVIKIYRDKLSFVIGYNLAYFDEEPILPSSDFMNLELSAIQRDKQKVPDLDALITDLPDIYDEVSKELNDIKSGLDTRVNVFVEQIIKSESNS